MTSLRDGNKEAIKSLNNVFSLWIKYKNAAEIIANENSEASEKPTALTFISENSMEMFTRKNELVGKYEKSALQKHLV